jgi:cell wall-associated NlpC family hydrolase
LRRLIAAGAVAVATSAIVSLPATAHATPSGVISVARRGEPDPVAAEAAQAMAALQRTIVTRDASTMKTYDQARDHIAAEIAARLEIDPLVLQAAWQRADLDHQVALMGAFTQLGVPYRRNTSKAGEGFDCSGLTTYAWSQAGFLLQRQSTAQIRASAPRDELTAQAGDLVQYPGHVMMWLGVERFIVHAPYSGRNVEVDQFSTRRRVKYGDPTG